MRLRLAKLPQIRFPMKMSHIRARLFEKVYRKNYQIALEFTKPHNKPVLDIGFASANFFLKLVSYTDKYIGIELSPDKCERTNQLLLTRKVRPCLVAGDARHMPFRDSSFTFAYALNTLEHIKKIDAALTEIKRVTSEGGYLIVSAPTENYLYRLGRKLIGFQTPKDHYYSSKEIEDKLSKHFKIIRRKTIYPILPLFRIYCCKIEYRSEVIASVSPMS